MYEILLQKTEQKKEAGVEIFLFFILIMKGKKPKQKKKKKIESQVIKQAFNTQKIQVVRFHWV